MKRTTAAALALALALALVAGCHHQPQQPGYHPASAEVAAGRALAGGAALASIAAAAAEAEGQAEACMAWSVAREAAQVAGALLAAELELGHWPALVVDVSSCGVAAAGAEVSPVAAVAVDAVLGQVGQQAPELPCAVLAAVDWVRGAAPAVLAEVAQPDGLVELPGVSGECD